TVDGTVTMHTGSTFQSDIDGVGIGTGGGNYSRLLVIGQDHTFVAAGTLQPLLRGITGNASNAFTPSLGETFRIVTAEGGIKGRFDQLAQPAAGLAANTRLQAFYDVLGSHSIDLRVTPTSYAVFAKGSNGNAQQAGTALDGVIAVQDSGAAASRQSELLYAVAGLAESQIAPTLKALSGEVHVDLIAAVHGRDLALQEEVADHLASDRVAGSDVSHGNRVWVNLSQGGRREVSDSQGSGFNSSGSAITLGADLFRSSNAWLGLGASHAESHMIAANGSGGINGDSVFVYGEQALGRVLLDGVAASSSDRWTTRRADPLGFAATLGSQTNGHDLTASLGLRMPFELTGSVIEPFARATWQRVRRDAFTETGESASALTSADYAQSGTRFLTGITGGSRSQDPFATSVTYRVGAALGVDQGGLAAPQLNVALGGQTMAIRTPNAGRGFVQFNANGTLLLDRHVYLYGGLTSEVGQRRSDYAVTAGLRVAL
ncbi:MAG: autotransporter outer membrane beta-barrel domain-containing protein, partial [Rhodanobacter sp.]